MNSDVSTTTGQSGSHPKKITVRRTDQSDERWLVAAEQLHVLFLKRTKIFSALYSDF